MSYNPCGVSCHPGVLSSGFGGSAVRHGIPIALGHAHNDEKHEVPLFGALAEGAARALSQRALLLTRRCSCLGANSAACSGKILHSRESRVACKACWLAQARACLANSGAYCSSVRLDVRFNHMADCAPAVPAQGSAA